MEKENINPIENIEIVEEIEKALSDAEATEPESDAAGTDDGEITKATVLRLIERITALTEKMSSLAECYESVSDDEDLPEGYFEAVQSSHGCLSESIRIINDRIESLTATANRMLDYLEKKQQAERPVSDREYLDFVRDFVANSNHGQDLPDFIALRESLRDDSDEEARIVAELERKVKDKETFPQELRIRLMNQLTQYYDRKLKLN